MDKADSPGSRRSVAERLLQRLADAVYGHRAWFVWPQLVLFCGAVWVTVARLEINMDRDDLVGSDKKYHRNFLKFKEDFPAQSDLVAVVESEDIERNRQFIERFGARLDAASTAQSPTNLLADVFYRGDMKMMGRKALLFVSTNDLRELNQALTDYQPFLRQFSRATNLVTLFRQVNHQIRTASREQNSENESMTRALPALERIVRRAEEALHREGVSPSPGVDALFGAGPEAEREKYVTFANGRLYLALARARTVEPGASRAETQSRQGEVNEAAVHLFRRLAEQTQAEVPGVNVGITGEPVLEVDEMIQSQTDSTVATILSLVVCALIFVVGYSETGRPLKAVFCLVIGLGYTMGYTTLVVGHLNILTVTFVPMLIGLAIDFGVHLITRYEEELRAGCSQRIAMQKAMVNTGQGIFTGCFTTAGAFFAMAMTDFKGIREMGIITGGGMIVCLIPMITLLPVILLRRGEQNTLDQVEGLRHRADGALEAFETGGEPADTRARLERLWLDRPWVVILVCAILTAAALWRFPRLYFDYNLLNMQSAGLPAVVFEKKLIRESDKSVLYAAVIADSVAAVTNLEARLRALPTVATTDSMGERLLEDPKPKLALISSIRRSAAAIHFPVPDAGPADLSELSQTLWSLQGYLSLVSDELARQTNADPVLATNVLSLRKSLGEFRYAMFQGDRQVNAERIGHFQRALFDDIRDTFSTLGTQDPGDGLHAADLPEPLRHRFIGVTGRHLIQVYPKGDIWQRDAQEAFVRELRSVDENATGTPVQLLEYTGLLMRSYVEAAGWALGAIFILVFIHFRRITTVLLALLPVLIGAIWMAGFMAWTGIPFNPANIMTLPLVIGIGVTNGIHILNRFAEEQNPSILAKSTGKAVLVSGLTTIAGFGSLVIAKHQGIQSLGWVMATGTATCMVAGLTFLPALLTLRSRAVQHAAEKAAEDRDI